MLAVLVGGLAGGWILDLAGRRRELVLGCLGMALCIARVGVAPGSGGRLAPNPARRLVITECTILLTTSRLRRFVAYLMVREWGRKRHNLRVCLVVRSRSRPSVLVCDSRREKCELDHTTFVK